MSENLIHRVRRMYAALHGVEEENLDRLDAIIVKTSEWISITQDFSGGRSNEEQENLLFSLISNIANLRDHSRRWASKEGDDVSKVDAIISGSDAIKVIMGLFSSDKHGPSSRPSDRGMSGRSPTLKNIGSVGRLTANAGGAVRLTLGREGRPQVSGSGSFKAVITGDIFDGDGVKIGDLLQVASEAMEAWERLMADFGIDLSKNSSARPETP